MSRWVLLAILAGVGAACGSRGANPGPAPTAPTATVPAAAPLQAIAEHTRGITAWPDAVEGQSVTVAGGPFNDIRFTWLGPPNAAPLRGRVYILSQEYLGRPGGLSESTPGFVARSVRLDDREYTFDRTVTLRAGRYWFLNDSDTTVYISTYNQDTYDGGDFYIASQREFDRPFVKYFVPPDTPDANFRLSGRPTLP
jgi:hypothetical protein